VRRSTALIPAVLLVAGPLLASAQAATPTTQSVTASASKVVKATWTGTVGAGVDSGGCGTSVGGSDTETLTYNVPSNLFKEVSTTTVISVQSKANNDVDLQVTDGKGAVVGSSTGSAGAEKVSLIDLPAGTYKVLVCTGSGPGDDYAANLAVTPKALPKAVAGKPTTAKKALLTFTPATVVDPVLFGGEPGFNFDPTSAGGNQRSFVDWPVSSRTMIGVLFRSEDGGLSYTKRYAPITDLANAGVACFARQVPYCPAGGGGDTDIDVNPTTGTVGMGEQESLANQALGVSLDHGTTFPADHVDPALAKTATGVDRQWQASWSGTKTRFMAYHVPLAGEFINRSDADGATGSWTIPPTPQIPGVTQSGSFVTDNTGGPLNHTLYVGYIGAGALVPGAKSGFAVGVSTDGAKSFTSHEIPGAASVRSFTTLAVDKAGNLYAAWVDSGTQKSYLATSLASDPINRKAPATKWSKAVQISQAPLNVTIFTNVVAGSVGRVAIGYYGTTAKSPTPDAVLPGQGGWKPYVAVSTDALCQWSATPCTSPVFSQDPISHKINHDTNICTSGTTCAASTTSNRNLLDYFAIDVDKAGHLGFVWSDTDNSTLKPFVKVARQASGPSLFAGQPAASLPQRGNGFADATGDAKYPIAGAKVLTAKSQQALDLAGTDVQRADNGDVVVTMNVPGLGLGQDGVLPGGAASVDDSGTPIQQARYVTRWDFKGQAYYAEATLNGTEGQVAYGAGTVGIGEGQFNGDVTSTLGNTYQPLTAATGKFVNGKLIVRVPASQVGTPGVGDVLYSVGSYSLLGPTDTKGSLQALPLTVDSSPTMDLAFGRATAAVPARPQSALLPPALSKPRTGGRSGLAATGLPSGLTATALVVLGAGLVLRRRRVL
jgi:hypothetical protein